LDEPLVESLAMLLHEASQADDEDAREIVAAEGTLLARNAYHVARLIRSDKPLPVLLVGKVFSWVPDIRERIAAALRKTGKVSIVDLAEGDQGAARLALELARGNAAGSP
jgi:hypothetical protein